MNNTHIERFTRDWEWASSTVLSSPPTSSQSEKERKKQIKNGERKEKQQNAPACEKNTNKEVRFQKVNSFDPNSRIKLEVITALEMKLRKFGNKNYFVSTNENILSKQSRV